MIYYLGIQKLKSGEDFICVSVTMLSQEDLTPALQHHTLGKQQDLDRVFPVIITTPVAQASESQPQVK